MRRCKDWDHEPVPENIYQTCPTSSPGAQSVLHPELPSGCVEDQQLQQHRIKSPQRETADALHKCQYVADSTPQGKETRIAKTILKNKNKDIVLGAGVRHSAHGKGHEEGGSTYAKAGSSLRSPPGNPRASTPITRACLLYYFVLLPTSLTLRGAVPHHLFQKRS